MLLKFLQEIPDKRRPQWRQFWLWEILFFSVLAILSWANSYRKINLFIKNHFKNLNKKYNLNWNNIPSYCTIRLIIQQTDSVELEKAFRKYSLELSKIKWDWIWTISIDWKVIRWSFDHFNDQKAIQILSAFLDSKIILAHEKIEEKTNEIPVSQKFFEELWVKWMIFTLDALHCQKKLLKK